LVFPKRKEDSQLALLDPLTALVVTFCFLGVMIYKRVNLGITLNASALLLALLALDLPRIGTVIFENTTSPLTISLVVASFEIMFLSLLYKETKLIDALSESLGRIINNSKLVVSLLPAVIGLLPVAGGALMSAPLVKTETEKLGLDEDKKTYVNLWFRHTIFPVYPVSPVLILTVSLTGLAMTSIIIRQIPVVISMIAIGYIISLRKTPKTEKADFDGNRRPELRRFGITFSPILATIIAVIFFGIDVSLAVFAGIVLLFIIAKPSLGVIIKSFRNWAIWGITLAAYGAFLLRNVIVATGFSQIFSSFLAGGSIDILILLTLLPALLGAITGSPSGGIALAASVLTGIAFDPRSASLLYISTYLGYVAAPTHLCLMFTADYFKCPLKKLYKYLIPSVAVSFAVGILVYLLV
jgi:integral membrane protein (TIGR00529 family)